MSFEPHSQKEEEMDRILKKWTQHPACMDISSDTVCGLWKVRGKRLHGLTRVISRLIHEPTLYRAANSVKKKRTTKQMYAASHRSLGTRVHRDMALLCRGNLPVVRAHPIAVRMWSFFTAQKRWIPIASEFKVWDETHKVTTAIDAVFVDPRTERVYAIEWKTGYEDDDVYNFRKGTLTLGNTRLPKSIAHAHQLQLALGCAMLAHSHPGLAVDKMYVVRVTRQKQVQTQDCVELIEVDPLVHRMVDLEYPLLLGEKSTGARKPKVRVPRVRVPNRKKKPAARVSTRPRK